MTSYVIGIKSRYGAVFSSFCVLIATRGRQVEKIIFDN